MPIWTINDLSSKVCMMESLKTDNQKRLFYTAVTGAVILIIIGFFTYLIFLQKQSNLEYINPPPIDPNAPLGDIGAACGGEMRLPCRPGNACLITDQESKSGVCVALTDNPKPVQPLTD